MNCGNESCSMWLLVYIPRREHVTCTALVVTVLNHM